MGLFDSLDDLYRQKDDLYEEKKRLIAKAESINAEIGRYIGYIQDAKTSPQLNTARHIPEWQQHIDNLRYEQQETSKGIKEIKDQIESIKLDIQFKKAERSNRRSR
jgi:chromosome segregation ATPase